MTDPFYPCGRVAIPPLEPAEPTDEEIWLAGIARQVEADARPLFAAVWVWLFHRALDLDEDEPSA